MSAPSAAINPVLVVAIVVIVVPPMAAARERSLDHLSRYTGAHQATVGRQITAPSATFWTQCAGSDTVLDTSSMVGK
jgi:hypothetical protein